MGQWGDQTYSSDSVMDFLQQYPKGGDLDDMDEIMAEQTLDDVFNHGSHFDRLGVVVWLLTQEFIVPLHRLQTVSDYANEQLHPDELKDWANKEKRRAALVIEMNDIRYALEHDGKGRKRETESGLAQKAMELVEKTVKVFSTVADENTKVIELPCHKMVVVLLDEELHALTPSRWGGGSITHEAKEVCKYCKNPNCEMDCPDFGEHCTDRDSDMFNMKVDERNGFLAFNGGVNAITSMVLAHAMAGIDIETPAYIEGIETALEALGNNT